MVGKLKNILVLVFMVIVAIVLGTKVAQEQYTELSTYVIVLAPLIFLAWGHRYTWQFVLFTAFAGVTFYHGFIYSATHVGAAALCGMFVVHLLQGVNSRMPDIFRQSGAGVVVVLAACWVLYGALHFAGNFALPHVPGDFAAKNALKAYFGAFVPAAIFIWMMMGPVRFKLGKGWDRQVVRILLIALVSNILFMLYLYRSGYSAQGVSTSDVDLVAAKGLHLPVVNMAFNIFAMRSLGPIAVAISVGLIASGSWMQRQTMLIRLIVWACLFLGLIGSILSGGRAAIVLCGFYGFVILVANRKIVLVMLFSSLAVLSIAVINLFSGYINENAPIQISRPLQYIMIDKGYAMETIEHSSGYREELFKASIDHWMSDARVLLVGRSVYRYLDNELDMGIRHGDEYNFVQTNLRAGTCHALLPSSLVQYGIIGTLLYYAFALSVIVFIFRLSNVCRKKFHNEDDLKIFPFIIALLSSTMLIVATIGGGWMSLMQFLFIGVFRSRILQLIEAEAAAEEEQEAAGQLTPHGLSKGAIHAR